MAAEPGPAALLETLRSTGIVDSIKQQLREQLLRDLKRRYAGKENVAIPAVAAAAKPLSLTHRIIRTLIADYLQREGLGTAYSAFIKDSALGDSPLPTEDVFRFLQLPLAGPVASDARSAPSAATVLEIVVAELQRLHGAGHADAVTQTTSLPLADSLEEKLAAVHAAYAQRAMAERAADLEERMRRFAADCEARWQREADRIVRERIQQAVADAREAERTATRAPTAAGAAEHDRVEQEIARARAAVADAQRVADERAMELQQAQAKIDALKRALSEAVDTAAAQQKALEHKALEQERQAQEIARARAAVADAQRTADERAMELQQAQAKIDALKRALSEAADTAAAQQKALEQERHARALEAGRLQELEKRCEEAERRARRLNRDATDLAAGSAVGGGRAARSAAARTGARPLSALDDTAGAPAPSTSPRRRPASSRPAAAAAARAGLAEFAALPAAESSGAAAWAEGCLAEVRRSKEALAAMEAEAEGLRRSVETVLRRARRSSSPTRRRPSPLDGAGGGDAGEPTQTTGSAS